MPFQIRIEFTNARTLTGQGRGSLTGTVTSARRSSTAVPSARDRSGRGAVRPDGDRSESGSVFTRLEMGKSERRTSAWSLSLEKSIEVKANFAATFTLTVKTGEGEGP